MYTPAHFAETRPDVLQALIRAHPLATLVTLSSTGLDANHIPLYYLPAADHLGVLYGHIARANPLWKNRVAEVEVLAIFQGMEHYISPSWYPTKQEHGKVVPTWNYAVVHAHGILQVRDDPAWIRQQLETLTQQQESHFSQPWAVGDAPADYIGQMLKAVVGIEIQITRLTGKWKTSQNQSAHNRAGVVDGLQAVGGDHAQAMAAFIAGM